MRRDPQTQFIAHSPAADRALTAEEIAVEIARLSGLLAHKAGPRDAVTVLMRVTGAIGTGGRA